MSVQLEFIDLIIPISNIDRVYKGGFAKFKEDNAKGFEGIMWHDDYLYRTGSMAGEGMEVLTKQWEVAGLVLFKHVNGEQCWNEVCVVEHMFGGATLKCDWLVVDCMNALAYKKGTEPGQRVSRSRRTT